MRISDWSSDVCSSDLGGGADVELLGKCRLRQLGLCPDGLDVHRRMDGIAHARAGLVVGNLGETALQAFEIALDHVVFPFRSSFFCLSVQLACLHLDMTVSRTTGGLLDP